MFGCYRRGEANDPDTYVAAVAMVLSNYPAEIVRTITDPYSGLPSRKSQTGWSGLPDVADVREACEAEASRCERLNHYAKMPKYARVPELPDPCRGRQRANLFVPDCNPKFPALVARDEKAATQSPCWIEDAHRYSNGEIRRGIMVPLSWFEDDQPKFMSGAA